MGSHFLFQGILPTQGWNLGLLHCRQILYCLNHQGSPVRTLNEIQLENKKTLSGSKNIAFSSKLFIHKLKEKIVGSKNRFSILYKKYLTTEQQIQKDENHEGKYMTLGRQITGK